MCGIAGIYRRQILDQSDPSRLKRMTNIIAHRGPDDFGYLLLDSRNGRFQIGQADFKPQPCDVCLSNRRLCIIDLSPNGRQPIHNEKGDIFITFNGEIFNYVVLRDRLATKGHVFRSRTDTEVIIHAYEEWGADCVAQFNGMWAFALWDQRKREMFCSRDRFGIKPFYYHVDNEVFLFASEIKGLLPALDARPSADYRVVSDYLLEGSLCRTRDTFFEGIKRLEPSHNLVVSCGEVRLSRYWDYRTQSQSYDYHRPVDTFRELLDDSVTLRLRGDVPIGIALSGGVDSTSILACAARRSEGQKLKAFTAVFPGTPFDEHEYARLAGQKFGVELFCINYKPDHFIEDLRLVTWFLDYPAPETQVLPRWQIMRLASRHVKVILEGQGADEMLAGYVPRYFEVYLMDELARMKAGSRIETLKKLFNSCREMNYSHGQSVCVGLLRYLVPRSLRLRRRRWLHNRGYTREFLHGVSHSPESSWNQVFEDRLTNLMHYDHAIGILPMLLKFGDALSMASSIESRLPFLDHRLVEFVFRLPSQHKLDGSLSKGILREAMAGIIPDRIRSRRDKIGFSTPMTKWIGHCLESGVRPLLISRRCKDRGILDVKKVDQLLTRQAEGKMHLEHSIFRWLSVELWFRLFIDGEGISMSGTESHLPPLAQAENFDSNC